MAPATPRLKILSGALTPISLCLVRASSAVCVAPPPPCIHFLSQVRHCILRAHGPLSSLELALLSRRFYAAFLLISTPAHSFLFLSPLGSLVLIRTWLMLSTWMIWS